MPEGGSNVDLLTDIIASTDADIVGLNEVFHPWSAGNAAALDLLAQRLGMHFAFGATQPANPHPDHPPYGNALLSRWPVIAYAAHHLAPAVSYGKRGLLETRILLPSGQPLTIYVTHLDHRSEEIRVAQWFAAKTWLLRDRGRPHFLLGDLNALSETDYAGEGDMEQLTAFQAKQGWPKPAFDLVDQVIKLGYVDAFVAVGNSPSSGPTYPAHSPERRIDYIFLPSLWAGALESCEQLTDGAVCKASDHLPVMAQIALAI